MSVSLALTILLDLREDDIGPRVRLHALHDVDWNRKRGTVDSRSNTPISTSRHIVWFAEESVGGNV